MDNIILSKLKTLNDLHPEWHENLLPKIQEILRLSSKKLIILDDDSLGSQTVYGIHVLTDWSIEILVRELVSTSQYFFILTNSRSLTLGESQKLHSEIGGNLKRASEIAGVDIEIVSRSDSTLRGHFPGELEVLYTSLGKALPPYLLIPFFLEGGRYTINNVHYLSEVDKLIPVSLTSYGQDTSFAYRNSELRKWVEEKTNGHILAQNVSVISLDTLRHGRVDEVISTLSSLKSGSACVVNAASYRDLEVFVLGLLEAESKGFSFLPRAAASFLRVRLGISPQNYLESSKLKIENSHGGLFVVGSYVPKTTFQIQALLEQSSIERIEVQAKNLLDVRTKIQEINKVVESANTYLKSGKDVVVYTSRELIQGNGAQENLEIGKKISEGLVMILSKIKYQPRYLVAKGGITSSDMATKWLLVQRALVIGQVLPGVPVWKLGQESLYPEMPFIIFPGNVGEIDALVQLQKKLSS